MKCPALKFLSYKMGSRPGGQTQLNTFMPLKWIRKDILMAARAEPGWPSIRKMYMGETDFDQRHFYLSVAAHTNVKVYKSLR